LERRRRRRPSGFAWPAIAAAVIFTGGRLAFAVIRDYEDGGLPLVIALGALSLLVALVLLWRDRRKISHWAEQQPPRPDRERDRAGDD
jgi:hypothetical protein